MSYAPQQFVNGQSVVSANWLNGVDAMVYGVLGGWQGQTVPIVLAALGLTTAAELTFPISVALGGTGAADSADALTSLGAFPAASFTRANLGTTLYPQIPAETSTFTALGFGSVVNPWYPPFYVDRYVTNTGFNDCGHAFTVAIQAALVNGGTVHYGATAPYNIQTSINATTAGSTSKGFNLINDQGPVAFTSLSSPAIIGNLTGAGSHVFDFTGTANFNLSYVVVGTGTNLPNTAFFQARNISNGVGQQGPSIGICTFFKCGAVGAFNTACYYNYGAEDDQIIDGYFRNTAITTNTSVMLWTGNNVKSQVSNYQTLASGVAQSNIDHKIYGGNFYNSAGTSTSDVFYWEVSDSVKIDGPWVCNTNFTTGGRAYCFVDLSNGPSNFATLTKITGEISANPSLYGIQFSTNAATPTFFTIDSCKFSNQTSAIVSASAGTILNNFYIRNLSTQVGGGINIAGTVTQSIIETSGLPITIGTFTNSTFVGYTEQLHYTSSTNLEIVDMGTTNKTISSGLTLATGFTTVGTVTTRVKCSFYSNWVDFSLLLAATSSVAWTAGATITLPAIFGATDDFAVDIVNLTTGALVGYGTIIGQTMTLTVAQTTSASNFCIKGRWAVS
jgi:hypothetical protein